MKTIDEERKEFLKSYAEITGMELLAAELFFEDADCTTDNGRRIHVAHAIWQAARNQSNNVPVAYTSTYQLENMVRRDGASMWYPFDENFEEDAEEVSHETKQIPLYTSPQQSNALEMAARTKALKDAAKLCELWNTTPGSKLAKAICNLIPQQESTAPQQAIPSDLDALIYEHTRFNINQADDAITIKGIKSLINAVLSAAPQPESDGK